MITEMTILRTTADLTEIDLDRTIGFSLDTRTTTGTTSGEGGTIPTAAEEKTGSVFDVTSLGT